LINAQPSSHKPPKITVHVKINPTDDVYVFEKDINLREPSGSLSHSSLSRKSSSNFMEPQSMFEVIHSFFTNTYVEVMASVMGILAIILPNYVTLVLTIFTQVLMIGIPSHLYRDEVRKRLNYYSIATLLLLAITVLSLLYKAYLTIAIDDVSLL
jgi:hypothetical protein